MNTEGKTTELGGPFMALEVTRRAAILLHGDFDTVFPLFGPIREADWADGWNPKMLTREVDPMREGCVFQTEHERGRAFWVLAQLERDMRDPEEAVSEGMSKQVETGRVQYVVVSPESHVARIRIELRADATATRAEIVYEFTGLTERGNAYVARHTPEYFTSWIHDWKVAIDHFLQTGTRLEAGKADQAHH